MGTGQAGFLTAALACSACVSVGYQRQLIERKPEPRALEQLAPGATDLADVLERLGAPLDVWEGAGGSPVLAYAGLKSAEWTFTVSVEVYQGQSATYSYSDASARTHGVILIFDRDLRLELVREGLLRDLRLASERRPAVPPADEAEAEP